MSLVSRVSLIAVVTMGLSGVGFVGAVLAQNPHAAPAAKMQSAPLPGMPRNHSMPDMKADQQKLDALVAAMNAAPGAEKLDRMAAVVNELAARESRMGEHMMQMMPGCMMNMPSGTAAPQQAPASEGEHDLHHPKN